MQIIQSNNANAAWRQTFIQLYDTGLETDNQKYFRDDVALIEISQPSLEPSDPNFPMSQKDLDTINTFIWSGENEQEVTHEWTKLYYHRMFDEPNNQIEYFLRKIQEGRPQGETQISMWDKTIDQETDISPCTQIIWGRLKGGKLELHVHAHSSDAYKKLLMNMQEFISLQAYLAHRLGVKVGKYYHFLDSCHLHHKDLVLINELREVFKLQQ